MVNLLPYSTSFTLQLRIRMEAITEASKADLAAGGEQRPCGEVPLGGVTRAVVSGLPDINPRVPPGDTPGPTDSSTRQGYGFIVYSRSTDQAWTSSDFAK
jgi:hypothetical protein